MAIRRLTAADADIFRDIRLAGLADTPSAFGSTHADEAARSLAAFAERLEATAAFGAFGGDELVGVAGFYRMSGAKQRHKGGLWGMYVRPTARGTGVGLALVQAVLDHAATEVEQVLLSVTAGNPARRLYERAGFAVYGTEPRALLQDETYDDEQLMVWFKAPLPR